MQSDNERDLWRRLYIMQDDIRALFKKINELEVRLQTKQDKPVNTKSPYDLSGSIRRT